MFNTEQPAYVDLRSMVAERTKPILVWTGSGLSAGAGLPLWSGLKASLLGDLRDKANTFPAIKDAEKILKKAQKIEAEDNYWISFGRLKHELGPTTWRRCIAAALTPRSDSRAPASYGALWRLPIRGIMNLNLDRLATRAFAECHPGVEPVEYSGATAARLQYMLNSDKRFIANLHGVVGDAASWVLTHDDLQDIMRDDAYKLFIYTCLNGWVNIFAGMTVDDVAMGGHLEFLAKLGIQGSSKFWLTSRNDLKTDRWAEKVGVRAIRYSANAGDHHELMELLSDLHSHISEDSGQYPPVIPLGTSRIADLPSPDELSKESSEDIRETLNRHASILLNDPDRSSDEFDRFLDDYDEQIHQAWFLSTRDGRNKLLSHELQEQVAKGSFGKVFRAVSPTGEGEAVKVLLEDVRHDREMLQAFRRGVQSMRILQNRGVAGMVEFKDASEIPAFVSMEWVEGPNLHEAKDANQLTTWDDVLRISVELAKIIRNAHALPERVLHRDIRPPNIMLQDYWSDPTGWHVVVLDFDLSWHRDAGDKSVFNSASGYLAPEQLIKINGVSSRNGAVDSFGLGMTLYFLCGGIDPMPGQHLSTDWESQVREAVSRILGSDWRSLATRFSRCIVNSTRDVQAARLDIPSIYGELQRLQDAQLDPADVTDPELLAEEIAANCQSMPSYVWERDFSRAVYASPTGMRIELEGSESDGAIRAHVDWVASAAQHRSKHAREIRESSPKVEAALTKASWEVTENKVSPGALHVSAQVQADSAKGNARALANAVSTAAQCLRF